LSDKRIPTHTLRNYHIFGVDYSNDTSTICDGTSETDCFYNISQYLITKKFEINVDKLILQTDGVGPNITDADYDEIFQRLHIINIIIFAVLITFSVLVIILRFINNLSWTSLCTKLIMSVNVCYFGLICVYLPFLLKVRNLTQYGFKYGAKICGITLFGNYTDAVYCMSNMDCHNIIVDLSRLYKQIIIFDIISYQIEQDAVIGLVIASIFLIIFGFSTNLLIKKKILVRASKISNNVSHL
jgi:hypothetical protein